MELIDSVDAEGLRTFCLTMANSINQAFDHDFSGTFTGQRPIKRK